MNPEPQSNDAPKELQLLSHAAEWGRVEVDKFRTALADMTKQRDALERDMKLFHAHVYGVQKERDAALAQADALRKERDAAIERAVAEQYVALRQRVAELAAALRECLEALAMGILDEEIESLVTSARAALAQPAP